MTIINHCRGTETKESCSYASLFVSIGNNNSISEKHRWCPCRLTSYRFASFSSMSRLESVAPHINSSKGRVRGKVSPVLSRASRAASLAPPVRPGADHAANANFSCEKAFITRSSANAERQRSQLCTSFLARSPITDPCISLNTASVIQLLNYIIDGARHLTAAI